MVSPLVKEHAHLAYGPLALATPLVLSPLAGYTNLPFRLVLREVGDVGLCTTDLVNARSLIERNPKALKLIETAAADRPLGIQLFGADADEMAEAARICQAHGAQTVDINMGCPVRKVVGVGAGSAMMTAYGKTARLVEQMVRAVDIPVTCKMRLGWDAANITAPELARALEDAGAAAIIVHGRTRAQGFDGKVNLPGIRRVVEAVARVPVVGNGDVTTPEAAAHMMRVTGCTGVGIGRGAFYNPWIFRATWHYLRTGVLMPEPDFDERLRVLTRHFELMVEVFGEKHGCILFRKVGPWYAKQFGPSSWFNKRIVRLESPAQYAEIVAGYRQWRGQFLDDNGELEPRFRPRPLAMDFDERELEPSRAEALAEDDAAQPAAAQRSAIPVPKGPNELW